MKLAIAGLAFVGLAATLCQSPALAQSNESPSNGVADKKVSINLENADVRYALKQLFQSVGVNYTLEGGVQGQATVSLTDVSFKLALESILRASSTIAPLTYRVSEGVYYVTVKKEQAATVEHAVATPDEPKKEKSKVVSIHLNFADVEDIVRALGGTVIQNRFTGTTGIFGGNNNGGGGRGGAGNGMNSGSSGFGNSFGAGNGGTTGIVTGPPAGNAGNGNGSSNRR